MINYSILKNRNGIKYNSLIIVDKFDREESKLLKLRKPNTTIVNSTMITDFVEAMQSNTQRKERELQQKLEQVSDQLDAKLTEQAQILKILDTLSKKNLEKGRW